MANERKNIEWAAGRVQIADPPVIQAGTGDFIAERVDLPTLGRVRISFLGNGLNVGGRGLDSTERVIRVSPVSGAPNVIVSVDPTGDTDDSFVVQMSTWIGQTPSPIDGTFSFTVKRVDTPIGVT